MSNNDDFELSRFLPYLLNRAADQISLEFSQSYKSRYNMLRTEWRVMVHLGQFGAMTAKEISLRTGVHKTKISRAVRALQDKRFILREEVETDRRSEILQLSPQGRKAHDTLVEIATEYDRNLATRFTDQERKVLKSCLTRLAGMAS